MKAGTDIYEHLIQNQKRAEILSLAERMGAAWNLRIFGSMAQKKAGPDNDIDLLIDPDPDRSLLDAGRLAMDLPRLSDRPGDVVTETGLRDRIHARVLREARAL